MSPATPPQSPSREKTVKIDLTDGGAAATLGATDTFVRRHIGPDEGDVAEMLSLLGYASLEEFSNATVPASIRLPKPMRLEGLGEDAGAGEFETLRRLRGIAGQNKVC